MRPSSKRFLLVVLLAAFVLPFAAPQSASAYVIAGKRWPGTTIRYHESFPPSWDYALNRAIRSWHATGMNIRFVKVSRPSQAQVRMFVSNQVSAGGDATLGYARGSQLRMAGNPRRPRFVPRGQSGPLAILFAHELGHVLGLHHVSRDPCSIMQPYMPRQDCGYDLGYGLTCRIWSRDDLRGALRMYGRARTTPRTPKLCFHGPAAPTPSNVQLTGAGATGQPLTMTWTKPRGTWTSLELTVRPAGRCDSTAAVDNLQTENLPTSARSWTDERSVWRELGSVCITLQAYGPLGRPAVRVRRTVSYTAWPIEPPAIGELQPSPDSWAQYVAPVTMASSNHSLTVQTVPGSTCAATPSEGTSASAYLNETSTSVSVGDLQPGPQCLSFFATAGSGWSTPVTKQVTVPDPPADPQV